MKYFLNRQNPDDPSELSLDSAETSREQGNLAPEKPFESEYFDVSKDVKLVTHGWMSNGNSSTVINIKNAYLETKDYNVIIVDWQRLARHFLYFNSVRNTKVHTYIYFTAYLCIDFFPSIVHNILDSR